MIIREKNKKTSNKKSRNSPFANLIVIESKNFKIFLESFMKTGNILHFWKASTLKEKLIALGVVALLSIGALGAIGEFSGGKGGVFSSLAETVGLKKKSNNQADKLNEGLTPPEGTLQLSKEYIYSGSRMVATEDYGVTNGTPTPTPTVTPTPTPTTTITPTPTATPSNGNNICLADMWTGGNSYLHPTPGWQVQTNGDLLSPTDNWWFAQSKMPLSQIGDWVEFDYTPLSNPSLRALNLYASNNTIYGFIDGAFYTINGYAGSGSTYSVGDKLKFQVEAGYVIKAYRNGALDFTFPVAMDPNNPLYITWGIYPSLPQNSLLKKPTCGHSGGGNPTFNLSASPTQVQTGGTVTVNWTANTQRPTNDWIGLYPVGAANNAYIASQYIQGGTSGSLNFQMPTVTGNYEFRYFPEGSYTLVATSSQVSVSNNPPISNIWQGGSALNYYNYTILANDDVIKPNGENWWWIKSRVALSQVGDWAEFDYVPYSSPRLGTNDLSLNYIYFQDWGFSTFNVQGSTAEGNNVPFVNGDKFKYQLAANNQVQVYRNGTLAYTFQGTRDPNKPLYIFWAQRIELPDGTTLKRPQFGGNGIIVDQ